MLMTSSTCQWYNVTLYDICVTPLCRMRAFVMHRGIARERGRDSFYIPPFAIQPGQAMALRDEDFEL